MSIIVATNMIIIIIGGCQSWMSKEQTFFDRETTSGG